MSRKKAGNSKHIEYIHQIMIKDDMDLPNEMTGFFKENMLSLKKMHKKSSYIMWSGRDIRLFLSRYFPNKVLETFDVLTAYAYKADLARLCILYIYGGLYVDLGVKLLRPFFIPADKNFCAFRDLYQGSFWFMIQNGLIFSEKKRPELLHAIQWIVENKEKRFYGDNSLFPTGPVQLGRAAALVSTTAGPNGDVTQWIGECRPITPSESNKNMIYSDPDGRLAAVRSKIHAGDLKHMGLLGGNNHNEIWQKRHVYNEKIMIWSASDPQIRVTHAQRLPQGIKPQIFGKNLITWGPYISLSPGHYKARILFGPLTFFNALSLEICCAPNCHTLHRDVFSGTEKRDGQIETRFSLDRQVNAVEIKLRKGFFFIGKISSFEIEENC